MEPPRENSPSTPSRYLNSYLQQNPTELFHQNFPQRQLSNQQFYAAAAADSVVTTNNKNYLKRHHQNYEKNESERDKKYEKYDSKKIEDQALHQGHTYDGFSNDAYSAASIATTTTGAAVVTTTPQQKPGPTTKSNLSNGKKTKGRVKIKMEYIDNKLRRYTTFSKRKTGIMKKAYELSTLTGTQVMLLVASETGHVYTFATRKLQPMITSEAGKTLIQTCLNSPDIPTGTSADQRMSATGFEETELNYSISDIGDNPGDKEKLSFQDDITSTDDSDESENDENFIVPSQQNNHKQQQVQQQSSQIVIHPQHHQQQQQQQRIHEDESKLQQHLQQTQTQNHHRINEKILDNQKFLLESLSNLPQNLLQSWIQSGQLQVSVDEDGMQSISIPFAIQKDNSTQEIITKKIPIKLLMTGKIKSEAE